MTLSKNIKTIIIIIIIIDLITIISVDLLTSIHLVQTR